jgi:dihydroorotase-like cyclic amidohydrolase
VGKDADIVLVDPKQVVEITNEQMLSKCGWTPFAGTKVTGKIEQVYVRGSLAYAHNNCLALPGSGQAVQYR